MKAISYFKIYVIGILFISVFCTTLQAQVGIGTITPHASSIVDMSSTTSGLLVPRMTQVNRNEIVSPADGLMIYQTNSIPGHYIYLGSFWVRLETESPPAQTVNLSGDIEISSATYAAVPGISTLVFTARKTSAFVMLTASGFAYLDSMSLVQLRVKNQTTATVIGGTESIMQSYDNATGTMTSWSASFSKLMTGLTVGTVYTLIVQGRVDGILGTPNAAIFEASEPDSHHMTLSVIQ
jgi:hypothetical protein